MTKHEKGNMHGERCSTLVMRSITHAQAPCISNGTPPALRLEVPFARAWANSRTPTEAARRSGARPGRSACANDDHCARALGMVMLTTQRQECLWPPCSATSVRYARRCDANLLRAS